MERVGLKALKNGLSKYIKSVARGETIIVTNRDQDVAKLVPIQDQEPRTKRYSPFIERGIREGWTTPARNKTGKPPPRRPPVMSFEEMMRDLDESCEDK